MNETSNAKPLATYKNACRMSFFVVFLCLLNVAAQSSPPDLFAPEGVSCQSDRQCAVVELDYHAFLLSFANSRGVISGKYTITNWNSISLGPNQQLVVGGHQLEAVKPSRPARVLLRQRVNVVNADSEGRISAITDSQLIRLRPGGAISRKYGLPGGVFSGAISRDGVVAGIVNESGRLSVWRTTGDGYREVCAARSRLYASHMGANSTWIAMVVHHKLIHLVDTSNCTEADFELGVTDIESLAIGKSLIAVSCRSGALRLLDPTSGKSWQVAQYRTMPELAFFPGTDELVVVTPDGAEVVATKPPN